MSLMVERAGWRSSVVIVFSGVFSHGVGDCNFNNKDRQNAGH